MWRAGLLAELFGVGGREKRALVMVEPPGYFRRIRKLEIHDDVFVAIDKLASQGCAARCVIPVKPNSALLSNRSR